MNLISILEPTYQAPPSNFYDTDKTTRTLDFHFNSQPNEDIYLKTDPKRLNNQKIAPSPLNEQQPISNNPKQ